MMIVISFRILTHFVDVRGERHREAFLVQGEEGPPSGAGGWAPAGERSRRTSLADMTAEEKDALLWDSAVHIQRIFRARQARRIVRGARKLQQWSPPKGDYTLSVKVSSRADRAEEHGRGLLKRTLSDIFLSRQRSREDVALLVEARAAPLHEAARAEPGLVAARRLPGKVDEEAERERRHVRHGGLARRMHLRR